MKTKRKIFIVPAFLMVLILALSLAGCGSNDSKTTTVPPSGATAAAKTSTKPSNTNSQEKFVPVPNVMGIGHAEAKAALEFAGFDVTEIEADASSILPNSVWGKRSVKKGEVFKVNDEIDFNYSDNEHFPIAPNNKVIIYYAKADYTYKG